MEKIHASKLLAGLVPAGFLTSDPEVELVTTDSREVRPGCIFVAFPGERFDGHDFAAKALEVRRSFPPSPPCAIPDSSPTPSCPCSKSNTPKNRKRWSWPIQDSALKRFTSS